MTDWPRLGVALLAAGSSRRYGKDDKLAAAFGGRPLGEHAAAALPMERFAAGWVITRHPRHRCEAYWRNRSLVPVVNDQAGRGMGTSVSLAAGLAKRARCDALLIALADMPCVPRQHFDALLDSFLKGRAISVSATGDACMPPAIFDAAYFVELRESAGDKGARSLIQGGMVVACPPDWLIDIDTPADFAEYGQAGDRAPTDRAKGDES